MRERGKDLAVSKKKKGALGGNLTNLHPLKKEKGERNENSIPSGKGKGDSLTDRVEHRELLIRGGGDVEILPWKGG